LGSSDVVQAKKRSGKSSQGSVKELFEFFGKLPKNPTTEN